MASSSSAQTRSPLALAAGEFGRRLRPAGDLYARALAARMRASVRSASGLRVGAGVGEQGTSRGEPDALDRAVSALGMSQAQRLSIGVGFFRRHAGVPLNLPMGYGFGQGVVDFLSWEIASGRLHSKTGSPWWRAVNGRMMLDLVDAHQACRSARRPRNAAVAAWWTYCRAQRTARTLSLPRHLASLQSLFWEAHQRSLHLAIVESEPLLRDEGPCERRFIEEVVLHNVDYAALANDPSYTDAVGLFTFALYPLHPQDYAATAEDLQRCVGLRVDDIPLSSAYGRRYADTGLGSSRWVPAGAERESSPAQQAGL